MHLLHINSHTHTHKLFFNLFNSSSLQQTFLIIFPFYIKSFPQKLDRIRVFNFHLQVPMQKQSAIYNNSQVMSTSIHLVRIHNPRQVQLTHTGTYSQLPLYEHFLNLPSSRFGHHLLPPLSSNQYFTSIAFRHVTQGFQF